MSTVIVCASEEIKAMIMASAEESGMKDKIKTALYNELEKMRDCEGKLPVDFGEMGKGGKGGPKKKRAPSGYNLFISDCPDMKAVKDFASAGDAMKKCAATWKKGGAKLKAEYDKRAKEMRVV